MLDQEINTPSLSTTLLESTTGSLTGIPYSTTVHQIHRQRQQLIRGHLQEINNNIDAKERLQTALYAKQTELEQIRKTYEDRFLEERTAKQTLESQIQLLRKQLQQQQTIITKEEKLQMENKLEEYEQKLRDSNIKLRDYNSFLKLRKRTETELIKLQEELSDLRKAKIAQIAVMKAERTKYERDHQLQIQKISKLEKEKAIISTELAKIKEEDTKKDFLLKQKQENLVTIKRKLRELTHNDMVQRKPTGGNSRKSIITTGILDPTRQRVVAAVAKSVTSVRRKTRISTSTPNKSIPIKMDNDIIDNDSHELRKQLENAALRIAEKEQRVEELERRLRARETDVRILEQLIEARDRIRQSMLVVQNNNSNDNSILSNVSEKNNSNNKGKLNYLVYDDIDREVGIDQALLEDINAFFATSNISNSLSKETEVGSGVAVSSHPPTHSHISNSDTLIRNNVLSELETRIETAQARIEYQDERILGLADDDEDIVADVLETVTNNVNNGNKDINSNHTTDILKRNIPLPTTLEQAQLQIKILFDMIIQTKAEDRNYIVTLEKEKEKTRILQNTIAENEAIIKSIRLESDRKIVEIKRQAVNETDLLLRLGNTNTLPKVTNTNQINNANGSTSITEDTKQSEQLLTMLQSARQKLISMEEKYKHSEKEKEQLYRELQYLKRKHDPSVHSQSSHHSNHHHHHNHVHNNHTSGDSNPHNKNIVNTTSTNKSRLSAAPPKVPAAPTSASARLSTSSITSGHSVDSSSLQIFGEKIIQPSRPSTASSVNSIPTPSIVSDTNDNIVNDNDNNGLNNNPGNKKAFDWWKERGIGIVTTNTINNTNTKARPSTANLSIAGNNNNIRPKSKMNESDDTSISTDSSINSLRSPIGVRNIGSTSNGAVNPSLSRPSSANTLASSTSLSNTTLTGGIGLITPSGPLGITSILHTNISEPKETDSSVKVENDAMSNNNISYSAKKRQQSLSSKYFANHPEIMDNNTSSTGSVATMNQDRSSIIQDTNVRTSGFSNNNNRFSLGSDVSTATTVSAVSQDSIEPVRIETTLNDMKSPIKKSNS